MYVHVQGHTPVHVARILKMGEGGRRGGGSITHMVCKLEVMPTNYIACTQLHLCTLAVWLARRTFLSTCIYAWELRG